MVEPPRPSNRDELRELSGWPIRGEIDALDRSFRVFTGNRDELFRLLAESNEPARAFQLWALTNKDGFERFLDEADRLIHNFLSAAMTLRDHTRITAPRLLPADDADDLAERYAARIEKDFARSPLVRFVQKLRNFTLHYRLPVATGSLSAGFPEMRMETRVVLHASDLLKWSDWGPLARGYIESAGDDIPVGEAFGEYAAVAVAFHEWFRDALWTRHRTKLTELEDAEAKVREFQRRAWGEPISGPR